MHVSTHADIEAPIAHVFQQLTDFRRFERQALRRGAEIRRRDEMARPGVGMGWDIRFQYRGKDRNLTAEISDFDPPNGMAVEMTSGGVAGVTVFELVALSRARTRLTVTVDLEARNLTGRLLLQSLKLARGTLMRRFEKRVSDFAREIQERHAQNG